ncbi:MAG TPA: cupredoxin domain-containing protein [archaeon]|nr:cupredoxin domain-containing protein [archaeon]
MKNKEVVLFSALFGLAILMGCASPGNNAGYGSNPTPTPTPGDGGTAGACPAGAPMQEVDVTARRFAFEPNPVVLTAGSCVEFHLTSQDVTHGFAVTELGINETITPGEDNHVTFYADPAKKGEYDLFCSIPCGTGHGGMRGKMRIE